MSTPLLRSFYRLSLRKAREYTKHKALQTTVPLYGISQRFVQTDHCLKHFDRKPTLCYTLGSQGSAVDFEHRVRAEFRKPCGKEEAQERLGDCILLLKYFSEAQESVTKTFPTYSQIEPTERKDAPYTLVPPPTETRTNIQVGDILVRHPLLKDEYKRAVVMVYSINEDKNRIQAVILNVQQRDSPGGWKINYGGPHTTTRMIIHDKERPGAIKLHDNLYMTDKSNLTPEEYKDGFEDSSNRNEYMGIINFRHSDVESELQSGSWAHLRATNSEHLRNVIFEQSGDATKYKSIVHSVGGIISTWSAIPRGLNRDAVINKDVYKDAISAIKPHVRKFSLKIRRNEEATRRFGILIMREPTEYTKVDPRSPWRT